MWWRNFILSIVLLGCPHSIQVKMPTFNKVGLRAVAIYYGCFHFAPFTLGLCKRKDVYTMQLRLLLGLGLGLSSIPSLSPSLGQYLAKCHPQSDPLNAGRPAAPCAYAEFVKLGQFCVDDPLGHPTFPKKQQLPIESESMAETARMRTDKHTQTHTHTDTLTYTQALTQCSQLIHFSAGHLIRFLLFGSFRLLRCRAHTFPTFLHTIRTLITPTPHRPQPLNPLPLFLTLPFLLYGAVQCVLCLAVFV